MWIIQEPNKLALWNKLHFEEKNGEYRACLKYSVHIFVEKIYKLQRLEVSGAVRPIYGSLGVKRLITVQLDETTSSLFIILQVHSTCFVCQPHPSPGVHKTVTTVSGTVQPPPSNVAKLAWPRWMEEAVQKIRPVSEAVVTILCTPYEGCGWHPKLVEWTCRIINRLLCVTSRWTVINPLNTELNPICQ